MGLLAHHQQDMLSEMILTFKIGSANQNERGAAELTITYRQQGRVDYHL